MVGTDVNISGGTVGRSLRAYLGSTVTITDGAVEDFLRAYSASAVTVAGGTAGTVFAEDGGVINVSSGSVESLRGSNGSTVNVGGGWVIGSIAANDGSTVNITGGFVTGGVDGLSGSTVNFRGGTVSGLEVGVATLNISGGSIGSQFVASPGGVVNISGTEFFLDGVLVDLETSLPRVIDDRDAQLSGLLADGSFFEIDLNTSFVVFEDFFSPAATLTLILVPEPASAAVLLSGAFVGLLSRRRRCRTCLGPTDRCT